MPKEKINFYYIADNKDKFTCSEITNLLLSEHITTGSKYALINSQNITEDHLKILLKDIDFNVRAEVVRSKQLTNDLFKIAVKDKSLTVMKLLVSKYLEKFDETNLVRLVKFSLNFIDLVITHPNCSEKVLECAIEKSLTDISPYTTISNIASIVSCKNATKSFIKTILNKIPNNVLLNMLRNYYELSEMFLAEVVETSTVEHRYFAIKHKNSTFDIEKILEKDEELLAYMLANL